MQADVVLKLSLVGVKFLFCVRRCISNRHLSFPVGRHSAKICPFVCCQRGENTRSHRVSAVYASEVIICELRGHCNHSAAWNRAAHLFGLNGGINAGMPPSSRSSVVKVFVKTAGFFTSETVTKEACHKGLGGRLGRPRFGFAQTGVLASLCKALKRG